MKDLRKNSIIENILRITQRHQYLYQNVRKVFDSEQSIRHGILKTTLKKVGSRHVSLNADLTAKRFTAMNEINAKDFIFEAFDNISFSLKSYSA